MLVRDVMTQNPVSCPSDATIQELAHKMQREDVGFIPIVDNNRLLGVVTDRDIVVRALARGARATDAIRDYISPNPDCVRPDMDVKEACQHMQRLQIRRLPVLENNRLVGIVSLGDLAETTEHSAEEVLVEVSKSPKTMAHKKF
jgi:CBS domain-containing protein